MKKKRMLLFAGLFGFVVLQGFNPGRTNPPVKNDFIEAAHPPAPVAASLRAACYDCHSGETRWPFYARIAPVSWLIARDVNEGREHLNFSEWPAEPERAARKLDRINEVLDYREMPPRQYTLIHAEARLTPVQLGEIMRWTEAAAQKLRPANPNP